MSAEDSGWAGHRSQNTQGPETTRPGNKSAYRPKIVPFLDFFLDHYVLGPYIITSENWNSIQWSLTGWMFHGSCNGYREWEP